MDRVLNLSAPLSRWTHDLLFDGPSQTLCARAWERRHHRAWRLWVLVFGANHCRASFEYWRGRE